MDDRSDEPQDQELERLRAAGARVLLVSLPESTDASLAQIDPHKRHIDKSVVADFWRSLETWIQANKPWLSF